WHLRPHVRRDLVQAHLDDPERHGHPTGHHASLFLQRLPEGLRRHAVGQFRQGHLGLERAVTAALDESLKGDLSAMEKAGTLKTFRHITGPMATSVTMAEKSGPVRVLSSNNYLGLADHPELVAAGQAALKDYGAGTASVRFICGTFSVHEEIEKALAKLSHTQAALTY